MPVNKNAFLRYRILDDLLSYRYRRYTMSDLLNDLNDRLREYDTDTTPIVRRTLEKDLRFLEDESGLDVELSRDKIDGKQYISYKDKNFSIFKKELTDNEKYLLKGAFSLIGSFDGLPELEGLESLRSSLNIKEERKIIYLSKNYETNTNFIGELYTDILNKTPVELTYKRFGNDSVEAVFLLYPYILKEYNRRWYLLASRVGHDSNRLSCYGLERIVKIERRPELKFQEYDGELEEYFDDIVGVTNYADEPVRRIIFWADDDACNYVTTKPIHDSQRALRQSAAELRTKYPKLNGGEFFSIDCKCNYELIRELSSFGPRLIVLSPEYIRDKIAENIDRMAEIYGGTVVLGNNVR